MRSAEQELRQVWCVAYDDDVPRMDGSHNTLRTREVGALEEAQEHLRILADRSLRAPKKNVRIETRFVTDWVAVDDEEETP